MNPTHHNQLFLRLRVIQLVSCIIAAAVACGLDGLGRLMGLGFGWAWEVDQLGGLGVT